MDQYAFVFNHYRVGRLIEAHTFEHLSFDRCWFSDELLDHLTTEAGQTVHLADGRVIIDHAYLERRVTPLDIYLKEEVGEKPTTPWWTSATLSRTWRSPTSFPGTCC
jgi:isocitrate dehydrogenase kinase/phosphatase